MKKTIIIVVSVLIVCAGAFFGYKFFKKQQDLKAPQEYNDMISEPQEAIKKIIVAYLAQKSNPQYRMSQALVDANLKAGVKNRWRFSAIGYPAQMFVATSTEEFPAGAGKQVVYDVKTERFSGYGIDQK